MSFKKLHLYRNRIEEEIIAFTAADNATVVREKQSSKRLKYTITFTDSNVLPAMVFFDFNDDGTTTIEDCRGKNKEYAAKLAEHIAKSTQVLLYDTDNLYFETITDEQFTLFADYMADCKVTFTTTPVSNGNKYSFTGEYGDTLYVTRYNNGSVYFQGHPSITFNNAITILTDIYPSDVILVGLTQYYKIDFSREELENELLNHCPNLAGRIPKDIINAMLPTIGLRRAIPEGLTDYCYLCFPILRGLEGLIRSIFKDKGVLIPIKSGFGGFMCYDDSTLSASVHPSQLALFTDPAEKSRVESLYALLQQQRHRIFHLDPMMPILLSKDNALDIIEQSLITINNAY